MNNNFCKRVAAEGMVLLKNTDNILPFKKSENIALVGKGIFEYHKGGLGSANVMSKYVINIVDGLKEKSINIIESSLTKKETYDIKTLNEYAKETKIALVGISRLSTEGADRELSDYYLSEEENKLFDALDKSDFENVVVILNIGGLIDIASIQKHKKVKAILIVWQPGMDGGSAVADVLCGDMSPEGRLTDTIALDYYDYPSAQHFDESDEYIYYCEDIFVGYRYFETFAKEKVLYPFGFGLSYANFERETMSFLHEKDKITVEIKVTNTGNFAGRDVVQLYFSAPKNNVLKSDIELCGYKKTKILSPNESEIVKIEIKTKSMAYFNENNASYILDKGEYKLYSGKNARELELCGIYDLKEDTITEKLSLQFTIGLPIKISADGTFEKTNIFNAVADSNMRKTMSEPEKKEKFEKGEKNTSKHTLYDVKDGKISLEEFISTLSNDQLLELSVGQPPAFPRGTAGIGNIPTLGIPNVQTADGPAGVRRTKPTTCFPCATLLACTWDEELLEGVGAVMGDECIENNVDILLAPGLNIHRNPLCGRNFEYYSEDPLIAGKTAAAVVRGVQSKGIAATIKHFALNDKENNRHHSSSVASERAIREIYLKGFEIAVKESSPMCIMSSYNKLNGTYTTANYNLLSGVLRGEWGYEGMVMTDWWVISHLWEEILSGNNVRMPHGYPDEIEIAKRTFLKNDDTRIQLEKNAYYILKMIMKTRRFLNKDFGKLHKIDSEPIIATDIAGVSSTHAGNGSFENKEECLTGLGCEAPGLDTFVYYRIYSEGGIYSLDSTMSCAYEGVSVEIFIDKNKVSEFECKVPTYDLKKPFNVKSKEFEIPKGEHEFMFYIRGSKDGESMYLGKVFFNKVK